jgi:subtilisin-like proprotein convertase family protein
VKTKFCIVGLLLAFGLSARATLYTYGGGAAAIPDNSTIGLTDAQTLGGLGTSITDVTLTLVLQGGFAGDLQGYLRLGNLADSTAYNLTSLIQGQTLSESAPTSYSIDLTTSFASQNPNNTWTLFFADTSPGGNTTLNSWSLDINAVPEPITMALPIFGALVLTTGLVRRFISRRTDRVV